MAKKDKAILPDSDDKWRIESDFRTLKEAEMIKCDEERFKKAMAFGKKEMKAFKSLEDISKYREEKYGRAKSGSDDDSDDK